MRFVDTLSAEVKPKSARKIRTTSASTETLQTFDSLRKFYFAKINKKNTKTMLKI